MGIKEARRKPDLACGLCEQARLSPGSSGGFQYDAVEFATLGEDLVARERLSQVLRRHDVDDFLHLGSHRVIGVLDLDAAHDDIEASNEFVQGILNQFFPHLLLGVEQNVLFFFFELGVLAVDEG